DSAGNQMTYSDDASTSYGGTGSVHSFDSYLDYSVPTTGDYYVAVSVYYHDPMSTGTQNSYDSTFGNRTYTLHTSINPLTGATDFGTTRSEFNDADAISMQTSAASSTSFSEAATGLPPNAQTIGLQTASLPQNALSVYDFSTSDATPQNLSTVSIIPHGGGHVLHLGWDWNQAAPLGTLDGGWIDVLNRGLTYAHGSTGSLRVKSFNLVTPTDPNNDDLTFTFTQLPESNLVSLRYHGEPLHVGDSLPVSNLSQIQAIANTQLTVGSMTFAYEISDGHGGSDSVTITVDVVSSEQKIVVDDRMSSDRLGYSVAMDQGIMVAGAPYADHYVDGQYQSYDYGAAYLFSLQANGQWSQTTRLTSNLINVDDRFGTDVDVDGNTIIIGAPQTDNSGITDGGAAYLYTRQGDGTWAETTRLGANDAAIYDTFGHSVAISGDYAIIGAPFDDNDANPGIYDTGSAYLFHKVDGVWTQQSKLLGSSQNWYDDFGYSVAIDGNIALVSSPFYDHSGYYDSGVVHVYERQADGNWNQVQILSAPELGNYDRFGLSLAVSGDTLVIGMPGEDNVTSTQTYYDSGAILVYQRQSDGTWTHAAKLTGTLTADGGEGSSGFGTSVAIDGHTIVAGDQYAQLSTTNWGGTAYVFKEGSDGVWSRTSQLKGSDVANGDQFGGAVAVHGDYAAIGASYADVDNGSGSKISNTGAVYSYYLPRLVDPLVFDLDGDGVHATDFPTLGHPFAMSPAGGTQVADGWIDTGDGFLVLDRNGNGQVDDVTEMFSEYFQEEPTTGLGALATLDDNRDGRIDARDSSFSHLAIWRDANADALTDEGELQNLAHWGISNIDLSTTPLGTPVEGARILSSGSFNYDDGRQGSFSELALHVTTPAPGNTDSDALNPSPVEPRAMNETMFDQKFMELMETHAATDRTPLANESGMDPYGTFLAAQQIFGDPSASGSSFHETNDLALLHTQNSPGGLTMDPLGEVSWPVDSPMFQGGADLLLGSPSDMNV
ncbi:MAG: FG-GAP repeat protein, partial [Magnetococcales bacterium]|nr:FG-GAP repeat protein [Magnetococcales bacterium]